MPATSVAAFERVGSAALALRAAAAEHAKPGPKAAVGCPIAAAVFIMEVLEALYLGLPDRLNFRKSTWKFLVGFWGIFKIRGFDWLFR